MTIESILERIAVALERRSAMDIATVVTETKALVDKLEEKDAKAPVKARKAKVTDEEKKTATDAEVVKETKKEVAAEAKKAESKKIDVADLRAVMQAYREKKYPGDKEGTSKSQGDLEKFTETLLGEKKGVRRLADLPVEIYQAVLDNFKVA